MRRLPEEAFDIAFATYLEGKLARLAVHPVANFVVAKALERVSAKQLAAACEEIRSVADKIFSSVISPTSVVHSVLTVPYQNLRGQVCSGPWSIVQQHYMCMSRQLSR